MTSKIHSRMKTLLFVLTLLLCAPAYAQSNDSLVVLFASQPGVRPFFLDGSQSVRNTDANGDGTRDFIMRREDDDGNLVRLAAFDMTTREEIWTLNLTGLDVGLVWGIYSLMVEGEKRRVVVLSGEASRGAFIFRPEIDDEVLFRLDPATYRLFGITDLNNDGSDDLIVGNRATRTVEVWGIDTSGTAFP